MPILLASLPDIGGRRIELPLEIRLRGEEVQLREGSRAMVKSETLSRILHFFQVATEAVCTKSPRRGG